VIESPGLRWHLNILGRRSNLHYRAGPFGEEILNRYAGFAGHEPAAQSLRPPNNPIYGVAAISVNAIGLGKVMLPAVFRKQADALIRDGRVIHGQFQFFVTRKALIHSPRPNCYKDQ